jgi:tetraacyldisaccharide 4'-kinase
VSPFSLIYGAATQLRNELYDRGVLKAHRLSKPVISVGNLSVGGSGKTPFVILLGELLESRDLTFDVLSRGYGRRTRGVLAVDPNGTPDKFGDEPLLIARKLGCPVIVGENRYEAGMFAERQFPTHLHILDDGFQHRSLVRDFDIVMLTPADTKDHVLPEGRLREPLSSLSRADALVVSESVDAKNLPISKQHVWKVRRGVSIDSPPENPVVFCGIARPRAFLEQLRQMGVRESVARFYRDHHRYSEINMRELMKLRDTNHAGGFITTEKDAINLGPILGELGDVVIARVTIELEQPDAALDTLLRVVAERSASA